MEAEGEGRGARTYAALLARAKALTLSEPNYGRFLLCAVRATDPDDLAPYTSAAIDTEMRRAYALLERRGVANHFVQISRPDILSVEGPEIIDIFTADMPFIVDSVLAAVRARGGIIRFVSHPVLPLDPESFRVLEESEAGDRRESFLHLHIDPLPDDAARAAMTAEIEQVLDEVAAAVRGWRPMLERLRNLVRQLRENPPPVDPDVLGESVQFLGWLAAHNFTFLGLREYRLGGTDDNPTLEPIAGSGIGLLEDPDFRVLRQGTDYVEMTQEHAVFLGSRDLLLVNKANVRSRVHRRAYMDYVGVKTFGPDGAVNGEVRIVGLFTTAAAKAPNAEVPLIRRKLETVLARSGASRDGHAGKALVEALDSYPRDELFQIDADELLEFATVIAALPDRPRVRVLPRIDRFDNFVSVLLYMPRDRYNSDVRARIGEYLAERYGGRVSAYYPNFPEGDLVRVHFIIGRNGGPTPRPDRDDLERDIASLTRSFGDRVVDAAPNPGEVAPYRDAFPPAYQSRTSPTAALADIGIFRELGAGVVLRLTPPVPGGETAALRFYHLGNPLALSDRVPLLENFGFRVIDEETYTLAPQGGPEAYIHDMVLAPPADVVLGAVGVVGRTEEALLAVWRGAAENDGFNQLTLTAGLAWSDVAVLRAFARYLRQLGLGFSQRYIAATLVAHPDAAKALVELFHALHDPAFNGDRHAAAAAAGAAIEVALDHTQSLDEDRIIRRLRNLAEASVRTNFYQRDGEGAGRPALAIKFDCSRVEGMPEPHPFREIFVYSPRVEGLHLRFGPIARGGIRWSDRPEDFRTEVLGLVKAQQVKNAIIVPVGAKGAFVPKLMPTGADRDTVQREGVACYKIFIASLLDLTDNIDGQTIVPPPDLVRRDGDDPYLVVAADKGTASFSDIANVIATERGYWLGDAFASGGSVGYDHKKMGITARGAWEAVKRHFREMGHDIQTEPFSVVGVGDMSGDVFGNGMLLSPVTRLVAAFDHRDIFIDPDPDVDVAFAERQRLFGLPRSSWQDYDRERLSKGGGVFSRSLKTVDLGPEARQMLGLGQSAVTPQQVMTAILRADVDLLWFGGIGTYVRGPAETNAEVGDRANDAIRVTGTELRAKVVGEGANLAVTQRGRIAYALAGGRIDTDAIDNSAGVNASDLEVNIKIALGSLVAAKRMGYEQRNDFLASMTGEVAGLCLANNYLQSLALSLAGREAVTAFGDHRALIEYLESRGQLQRAVEFLPDDAALAERAATGRGFTRPEQAVLLAYAKNALEADLVGSAVPDDPYLAKELFRYFPDRLVEQQREAVSNHRLRREVIATVLANAMINRGGPAFLVSMMSATSADAGAVTHAYAAARDSFGLTELNRLVDTLDGRMPGAAQLDLYAEVQRLLRRQVLWFLRNATFEGGLADIVTRYAQGVADIRSNLPSLVPAGVAEGISARARSFGAAGVPQDVARRFAELSVLAFATDIVLVAGRAQAGVIEAARAFFAVLDLFGLHRIIGLASALDIADRYDRMALDRGLANLMRAQRDLTADVLAAEGDTVVERFSAWHVLHRAAVERTVRSVADLTEGELTVSRLTVAAGLLADLARGT
jgi:glutamate dehydrogenase